MAIAYYCQFQRSVEYPGHALDFTPEKPVALSSPLIVLPTQLCTIPLQMKSTPKTLQDITPPLHLKVLLWVEETWLLLLPLNIQDFRLFPHCLACEQSGRETVIMEPDKEKEYQEIIQGGRRRMKIVLLISFTANLQYVFHITYF